MHYINADGNALRKCAGNGVRCFAKYLVDRGFVLASDGSFVADTLAGPKPISFEVDKHDKLTFATVDMGHPVLEPQNVPVDLPANALTDDETGFVKDSAIESPWGRLPSRASLWGIRMLSASSMISAHCPMNCS